MLASWIGSTQNNLIDKYLTQYWKTLQWRHNESFASLAFVKGIHRWPVNSPHNGPVTRKVVPFDDVIMSLSMSLLATQGDNWLTGADQSLPFVTDCDCQWACVAHFSGSVCSMVSTRHKPAGISHWICLKGSYTRDLWHSWHAHSVPQYHNDMMVAVVLESNKHQTISYHHTGLSVTTGYNNDIEMILHMYLYWATSVKQAMFQRKSESWQPLLLCRRLLACCYL